MMHVENGDVVTEKLWIEDGTRAAGEQQPFASVTYTVSTACRDALRAQESVW